MKNPGNDAARAAALILDSFLDYHARFADITRRARRRFEARDWQLSPHDAAARIDLAESCLDEGLARLEQLAEERVRNRGFWAQMKREFARRVETLVDRELAKTWFNSLSRRFFRTEGVAGDIEFTALDRTKTDTIEANAARHRYQREGDLRDLFVRIFADFEFRNGYCDPRGCAQAITRAIGARFPDQPIIGAELLKTVFFRERRGYLVGRLRMTDTSIPLVIALVSDADGIRTDAVLTDPLQIAVLFGYTRSYFQADLATVHDTVRYLHELLPGKPLDELYTVLGRARHGKTERYRALFQHLHDHPDERFVRADGDRGMVMAVFTTRDYPLVFKVIRDHFAWPKQVARQDVEDKYHLVFRHDRVGRLVDAQEYRQLHFPAFRFDASMLDELLGECASSVHLDGGDVVIRHCYVERRIRPLNLYAREAPEDDARRAIIDYGQAIKDLARSNIFPGDLLLKNFGIARSGRAIFYDYDELCLVSECRFRQLPDAAEGDEMRPIDDYVSYGDNDVFPEQFPRFLGVPAVLRDALLQRHPEIFDARWWLDLQASLRDGAWNDVPPYPSTARLSREPD